MTQVLALSSAVMFGFGDFMGGLASRRMRAWSVLVWSQTLSLPVLAAAVLIVDRNDVRGIDLGLGALAGLLGIIGLGILYTALAGGTMPIVAPTTGAVAAAVPVVGDLVTGARLSAGEWVGIVVAIGAVLLIGYERADAPLHRRSVILAVAAGLAFGVFFIALAGTSEDAGLWPAVVARGVSIPAAAVAALGLGGIERPQRRVLPLIGGAGTLDITANVTLLLSLQRGPLAVNAVLSSLFPAFTAFAAVVLLRERPGPRRAVGIALALGAAGILAI